MSRRHLTILLVLMTLSMRAQAQVICESLFTRDSAQLSVTTPRHSIEQAWKESVSALHQINTIIYSRRQAVEAMTTAMLAREFVWINGEPGGAKTFLSRLMFQAALNSLSTPEKESFKKIFVLQFHKLVSEGKISGFQKFSSMMKEGKYEVETSTSLVGDSFLYLIADEAEKSNPAVLNALLSILNERKAFLGSRVIESMLASGVFTSNKTTGQFIKGFYADRPSGEALLDRMAIKLHLSNQEVTPEETVAMNELTENAPKLRISLPLKDLVPLLEKIKIPDDMMKEIVEMARAMDLFVTDKADKSRAAVRFGEIESEYFPSNQFSNRSIRRLVQIFKANLLTKQLMEGVSFENLRLTPQRLDLALIAKSAVYIGPSDIGLKTFPVTELKDDKVVPILIEAKSDIGVKTKMVAEYSPYENKIQIKNKSSGRTQMILIKKNGQWTIESKSPAFSDWTIDLKQIDKLEPKLQEIITENKIDPSHPVFIVDNTIDRLIDKGTFEEPTRVELASIKQDLVHFAEVLNRQLEKDRTKDAAPRPAAKFLPARSEKQIRNFRRDVRNLTPNERAEKYYDWMLYEVSAMKQRFVELDYSIEAHLTGLLSRNHLYVFGPPGGAKTALAEVILKSELRKANADEIDNYVSRLIPLIKTDQTFLNATLARMQTEKPKVFKRFLLQFHKLLPEGVLIGFPKVEKQLNEGIEEIEVSSSLANQEFIFAILDEVDKANPQTITTLLSILNEREVFAGSQVIKTALRTAILTSNKMPSEFLDSYNEDRSSGTAVMDRTANKVYVSNKISNEEALTQFLINLEKGISPSWKGMLAIDELEPLVEQVSFDGPATKLLLATVHQKFLALRIAKAEETKKKHQMDPREFPDYYVAASLASNRTFNALMKQFKARFIVHQLMQGVAFKDIRTHVELRDLDLFFEGLAYWAPQKITHSYNSEGVLTFKNESPVLEKLLGSGVLDSRVKFHIQMMLEESQDYSKVLNSVVGDFVVKYKAMIIQYPDLFPSWFAEGHAPTADSESPVQAAPGSH